MKFQTPYDKESRITQGEKNTLPSMTIPDQTMSIPELIKRYATGLPLGAPKVALYDDDPENDLLGGTNWNKLDLTEKANFIKAAKNELKQLNKKFNKVQQTQIPLINQQTENQEEINE